MTVYSKMDDLTGENLNKSVQEDDHLNGLAQSLHMSPAESGNKVIESGDLEQLKESILVHLSNYTGELFFKSQQRNEPTLSNSEKKEIAARILESNPSNFLARFGKALEEDHLNYFHQYENEYEVKFYLQLLKKSNQASTLKNQRFIAMNELIKKGEYFSLKEMRKRNPVNFYHMVEKYMSSEEKRDLDEQEPKMCNLSTIFMAHIDGSDSVSSKRKLDQLSDESVWDQYKEELEEDEDEDEDDGIIDQVEKKLFREEFVSSMHRSFLEGRDEEYDYSQIDPLNLGDDITHERDAEERYFDSD